MNDAKFIKGVENIDKKIKIGNDQLQLAEVEPLHTGKNYYCTIAEAAIAISMVFGTTIAKNILDMYINMECTNIKIQRIRCTRFSISIKESVCVELYDDGTDCDPLISDNFKENYINPTDKNIVKNYTNI